MSYIWRTAANIQESPPPLSDLTVLKIRIGITILLGLALVYACFILATFRRYGSAMDVKWAARIDSWRLDNMYLSGSRQADATSDATDPYTSHPDGSVFNTVSEDISPERRSAENSQVRFRDDISYIPSVSAPSGSPANIPPSRSERHRDVPELVRVGNSMQADTPPPLGPTHSYSRKLPQTPSLSRSPVLPLQPSPESPQSSIYDKVSFVTPEGSDGHPYQATHTPRQDTWPISIHIDPPSRPPSIFEDQRTSPTHLHAEPILLPEVLDRYPSQATYTSWREYSDNINLP